MVNKKLEKLKKKLQRRKTKKRKQRAKKAAKKARKKRRIRENEPETLGEKARAAGYQSRQIGSELGVSGGRAKAAASKASSAVGSATSMAASGGSGATDGRVLRVEYKEAEGDFDGGWAVQGTTGGFGVYDTKAEAVEKARSVYNSTDSYIGVKIFNKDGALNTSRSIGNWDGKRPAQSSSGQSSAASSESSGGREMFLPGPVGPNRTSQGDDDGQQTGERPQPYVPAAVFGAGDGGDRNDSDAPQPYVPGSFGETPGGGGGQPRVPETVLELGGEGYDREPAVPETVFPNGDGENETPPFF
jgi:hypothetical protein